MRQFLLGAGTMLVALLVAALALVWSVGSPGSGPRATQTPSTAPTRATPPEELEGGDTWLGDVRLTSADVATGDGPLTDVAAVGSGVLLTSKGLEAGRLELDATLPFESAAGQIGAGVTLSTAPSGRASLRRTVNILSRDITVRTTGQVRAVGGQLVITPETIDLDGPDWLDTAASAVVRELVTIRHTVQGVPQGMALTSVKVQTDGFRVHLSGANVSITR